MAVDLAVWHQEDGEQGGVRLAALADEGLIVDELGRVHLRGIVDGAEVEAADLQDAGQRDRLRLRGGDGEEVQLRGALAELRDGEVQDPVLRLTLQGGDEPHLDVQRGAVLVLDDVEDLNEDAEGHRVVTCDHYRR